MASSGRRPIRLPALALLAVGCNSTQDRPADLVIRHAAIYTAVPSDTSRLITGSMAIRDGRIVYLGADSALGSLIGDSTEVVDGAGGMLLPGFIDSHVHPYSGVELQQCDLSTDSTAEQAVGSLMRCAEERPAAPWILGTGWQLPLFPGGSPTAAMLDRAAPDRPAYITAADGHSAWVNSRALTLAGVTGETPDPLHGRIERDSRGTPTGTLRESAMALVGGLVPEPTVQEYSEGFRVAFDMAVRNGITAIIDANADSAMLEAYRIMDSAGTLPIRVTLAQSLDRSPARSQVQRLLRLKQRVQGRLVEAGSAKIFLDGVIEARTAALLTPYHDLPGNRGEPNLTQAALDSLVVALDSAGLQVHVHAIGDRAVRMALNAFEQARTDQPGVGKCHQIAHLELIDPADVPRFKELGVIANFQPLWAYDDSYIVDLTIPALGPARSRWLYPLQSVLATGATVVAGSDWSVSSMNPLEAIQVAVTRRAVEAGPGEGWLTQERAGLRQMLAAYTRNGAYGRFADSLTGSLEIGKLADVVLLDRNLFDLAPHEIARARVVLTVMDGRVRYRRAQ